MLRVKGIFISKPLIESVIGDLLTPAGPFLMRVDRPNGMDRLRLQIESASDVSAETATTLVTRLKARATVAVEVEIVAAGALGEPASWFIDERT
jgi:phenylacetate-coenzyme A ligase PaaK-like adenylate-forming protein